MLLTFLGHAGFLVETEHAVIVADPWLSPTGAFDSAWMQFPRNHQLAPLVRDALERSPKRRFLYVSHEHRDHFDPDFLRTLDRRDVTVVLPRFRRPTLLETFGAMGFHHVVTCADGEQVPFEGGSLRLFVSESGVNRDSSLLVREGDQRFLDLNDCKIHDRLPAIVSEEGRIDVLTGQFSGAIWHPVCYRYDRRTYASISRRKTFSKFEAVARAVEVVRPRTFIASAGPPCFLDPALLPINFEPVNIFPRAPKLFEYLRRRLRRCAPDLLSPMPGDVLDAGSGTLELCGEQRLDDDRFEEHVRSYADAMSWVFRLRRRELPPSELSSLLHELHGQMRHKLDQLSLRDRVLMPFYACIAEKPQELVRVDFHANQVSVVPRFLEERRCALVASAVDLLPVVQGRLTWEEFLLSLRFQISREPDLYDAILHGFLAMEAADLPAFCRSVRETEAKQDRMIVCAGGKRYSVQRFCPHQGADLEQGWVEGGRFLVCPRHRWRFDLEQGGACPASSASLCARELDGHPREAEVEAKAEMDVGMDLGLEAESGASA